MAQIVQNWESVQYNGTNGDYICDTWLNVSKVSESGGILVYATPEGNVTVNTNDYVLRNGSNDEWGTVVSPSVYADKWHEIA